MKVREKHRLALGLFCLLGILQLMASGRFSVVAALQGGNVMDSLMLMSGVGGAALNLWIFYLRNRWGEKEELARRFVEVFLKEMEKK